MASPLAKTAIARLLGGLLGLAALLTHSRHIVPALHFDHFASATSVVNRKFFCPHWLPSGGNAISKSSLIEGLPPFEIVCNVHFSILEGIG